MFSELINEYIIHSLGCILYKIYDRNRAGNIMLSPLGRLGRLSMEFISVSFIISILVGLAVLRVILLVDHLHLGQLHMLVLIIFISSFLQIFRQISIANSTVFAHLLICFAFVGYCLSLDRRVYFFG